MPAAGAPGSSVKDDVAPDHEPRELADIGCRVSSLGGPRPPRITVTRSATCHHLLQLVGDEEDGLAAGLEAAQHVEEGVDLAGRQDAGRLVEDENFGVAVEQLEDLDPLLLAHRQCPVWADGSTSNPKDALSSAMRCADAGEIEAAPPPSSPSMTFSVTVSGPPA